MTPMHAAASAGLANILSLLIEHGADLNGRGMSGDTPLCRASENGKVEAGQLLLNRTRDRFNDTALSAAIYRGHVEFARMILDRGGTD